MHFARPEYLWFLLGWPVLAWWSRRAWRASGEVGERLGWLGRPGRSGWIGCGIAWGLLVLAAGGPEWGATEVTPDGPGRDLVLLFDQSRSMGAGDAFPSRLGAAIQSAKSLIASLAGASGDRVAVVGFAGRGAVRCPLTANLDAATDAIAGLRAGGVEPPGTDLGAGLLAAKDCFDDIEHAGGRTVVVFTDGEDFGGSWSSAAGELQKAGIVVHAVAFGDPEKAQPVPGAKDGETWIFQGKPATTRRQDEALESVAEETGGTVVRLGLAAADLGSLYRDRIEPTATRIRKLRAEHLDRPDHFRPFAFAALVAMCWACWPSTFRLRSGGVIRLASIGLVLLSLGADSSRNEANEARAAGYRSFRDGDYRQALGWFERALAVDPDDTQTLFDIASVHARRGEFEGAESVFNKALGGASPVARFRIEFAMGNNALALGDVEGAIRHYDSALAVEVPNQPGNRRLREDAAINREFARNLPPPVVEQETPPEGESPSGKSDGQGDEERKARSKSPSRSTAPPEGDSPPSGSRGAGGQGGTGGAERPPGSPDEQFRDALDAIRHARDGRLSEADAPPAPRGGDRPDW